MIQVSQKWKDIQKEIVTSPAHISAIWYNTVSQEINKAEQITSNFNDVNNNIYLGLGTRQENVKYATLEPDLWTLDGKSILSDKEIWDKTEYYVTDTNTVGEYGIDIPETAILAGKGISIMVSEFYKNTIDKIQIIGYDGNNSSLGREIFNIVVNNPEQNNTGYYDCQLDEEYSNPVRFIKILITPKNDCRCRLNSIVIGEVISIGTQANDDIPLMSFTQTNHADLYCESIPTNEVSFEMDLIGTTKVNNRATIDGNSIFRKQQPIDVKYGYEIDVKSTTVYYIVLENGLFYVPDNLQIGDIIYIGNYKGEVISTDSYYIEDYKYNYMGVKYTIQTEDNEETFIVPIEFDTKEYPIIEWINVGTFFLSEWDIQQGSYTGTLKAIDPISLFTSSIVAEFKKFGDVYKYSDIFTNGYELIKSFFKEQDLSLITNTNLADIKYPQNDVPFEEWINSWALSTMELGQLIQIYCNANLTSIRYSNENTLDIFNVKDFNLNKVYESGLIGDMVNTEYLVTPDNITEYPIISQNDVVKDISTTFKDITKTIEDNKTTYNTSDITIKQNMSSEGTDYTLDNPILINNNGYIVSEYLSKYNEKISNYIQTIELSFRADPRLQPLDIIVVKSTSARDTSIYDYEYFGEDDIEDVENVDNKTIYADIVLVTNIEYSYAGTFTARLQGIILAYNIQLDSNKYEAYTFNENSIAVLYTGDEINVG